MDDKFGGAEHKKRAKRILEFFDKNLGMNIKKTGKLSDDVQDIFRKIPKHKDMKRDKETLRKSTRLMKNKLGYTEDSDDIIGFSEAVIGNAEKSITHAINTKDKIILEAEALVGNLEAIIEVLNDSFKSVSNTDMDSNDGQYAREVHRKVIHVLEKNIERLKDVIGSKRTGDSLSAFLNAAKRYKLMFDEDLEERKALEKALKSIAGEAYVTSHIYEVADAFGLTKAELQKIAKSRDPRSELGIAITENMGELNGKIKNIFEKFSLLEDALNNVDVRSKIAKGKAEEPDEDEEMEMDEVRGGDPSIGFKLKNEDVMAKDQRHTEEQGIVLLIAFHDALNGLMTKLSSSGEKIAEAIRDDKFNDNSLMAFRNALYSVPDFNIENFYEISGAVRTSEAELFRASFLGRLRALIFEVAQLKKENPKIMVLGEFHDTLKKIEELVVTYNKQFYEGFGTLSESTIQSLVTGAADLNAANVEQTVDNIGRNVESAIHTASKYASKAKNAFEAWNKPVAGSGEKHRMFLKVLDHHKRGGAPDYKRKFRQLVERQRQLGKMIFNFKELRQIISNTIKAKQMIEGLKFAAEKQKSLLEGYEKINAKTIAYYKDQVSAMMGTEVFRVVDTESIPNNYFDKMFLNIMSFTKNNEVFDDELNKTSPIYNNALQPDGTMGDVGDDELRVDRLHKYYVYDTKLINRNDIHNGQMDRWFWGFTDISKAVQFAEHKNKDLDLEYETQKYQTWINLLETAEALDMYFRYFTDILTSKPKNMQSIFSDLETKVTINNWRSQNLTQFITNLMGTLPGMNARDKTKAVFDYFKQQSAFKIILSLFIRIGEEIGGEKAFTKTFKSANQVYDDIISFIAYNPNEDAIVAGLNLSSLLTDMINAIASKIYFALDVHKMVLHPGLYASRGDFSISRLILGGADPKVKPEIMEIYFRVPLLIEFYINFLINDNANRGPRIVNQNMAFSFVPANRGPFAKLWRIVSSKQTGGYYTADQVNRIIGECNALYLKYKSCDNILREIVNEVNGRIGIISQDSAIKALGMYYKNDLYEGEDTAVDYENRTDYDILSDIESNEGSAPSSEYTTVGKTLKYQDKAIRLHYGNVKTIIEGFLVALKNRYIAALQARNVAGYLIQRVPDEIDLAHHIRSKKMEFLEAPESQKQAIVAALVNGYKSADMDFRVTAAYVLNELVIGPINNCLYADLYAEKFYQELFDCSRARARPYNTYQDVEIYDIDDYKAFEYNFNGPLYNLMQTTSDMDTWEVNFNDARIGAVFGNLKRYKEGKQFLRFLKTAYTEIEKVPIETVISETSKKYPGSESLIYKLFGKKHGNRERRGGKVFSRQMIEELVPIFVHYINNDRYDTNMINNFDKKYGTNINNLTARMVKGANKYMIYMIDVLIDAQQKNDLDSVLDNPKYERYLNGILNGLLGADSAIYDYDKKDFTSEGHFLGKFFLMPDNDKEEMAESMFARPKLVNIENILISAVGTENTGENKTVLDFISQLSSKIRSLEYSKTGSIEINDGLITAMQKYRKLPKSVQLISGRTKFLIIKEKPEIVLNQAPQLNQNLQDIKEGIEMNTKQLEEETEEKKKQIQAEREKKQREEANRKVKEAKEQLEENKKIMEEQLHHEKTDEEKTRKILQNMEEKEIQDIGAIVGKIKVLLTNSLKDGGQIKINKDEYIRYLDNPSTVAYTIPTYFLDVWIRNAAGMDNCKRNGTDYNKFMSYFAENIASPDAKIGINQMICMINQICSQKKFTKGDLIIGKLKTIIEDMTGAISKINNAKNIHDCLANDFNLLSASGVEGSGPEDDLNVDAISIVFEEVDTFVNDKVDNDKFIADIIGTNLFISFYEAISHLISSVNNKHDGKLENIKNMSEARKIKLYTILNNMNLTSNFNMSPFPKTVDDYLNRQLKNLYVTFSHLFTALAANVAKPVLKTGPTDQGAINIGLIESSGDNPIIIKGEPEAKGLTILMKNLNFIDNIADFSSDVIVLSIIFTIYKNLKDKTYDAEVDNIKEKTATNFLAIKERIHEMANIIIDFIKKVRFAEIDKMPACFEPFLVGLDDKSLADAKNTIKKYMAAKKYNFVLDFLQQVMFYKLILINNSLTFVYFNTTVLNNVILSCDPLEFGGAHKNYSLNYSLFSQNVYKILEARKSLKKISLIMSKPSYLQIADIPYFVGVFYYAHFIDKIEGFIRNQKVPDMVTYFTMGLGVPHDPTVGFKNNVPLDLMACLESADPNSAIQKLNEIKSKIKINSKNDNFVGLFKKLLINHKILLFDKEAHKQQAEPVSTKTTSIADQLFDQAKKAIDNFKSVNSKDKYDKFIHNEAAYVQLLRRAILKEASILTETGKYSIIHQIKRYVYADVLIEEVVNLQKKIKSPHESMTIIFENMSKNKKKSPAKKPIAEATNKELGNVFVKWARNLPMNRQAPKENPFGNNNPFASTNVPINENPFKFEVSTSDQPGSMKPKENLFGNEDIFTSNLPKTDIKPQNPPLTGTTFSNQPKSDENLFGNEDIFTSNLPKTDIKPQNPPISDPSAKKPPTEKSQTKTSFFKPPKKSESEFMPIEEINFSNSGDGTPFTFNTPADTGFSGETTSSKKEQIKKPINEGPFTFNTPGDTGFSGETSGFKKEQIKKPFNEDLINFDPSADTGFSGEFKFDPSADTSNFDENFYVSDKGEDFSDFKYPELNEGEEDEGEGEGEGEGEEKGKKKSKKDPELTRNDFINILKYSKNQNDFPNVFKALLTIPLNDEGKFDETRVKATKLMEADCDPIASLYRFLDSLGESVTFSLNVTDRPANALPSFISVVNFGNLTENIRSIVAITSEIFSNLEPIFDKDELIHMRTQFIHLRKYLMENYTNDRLDKINKYILILFKNLMNIVSPEGVRRYTRYYYTNIEHSFRKMTKDMLDTLCEKRYEPIGKSGSDVSYYYYYKKLVDPLLLGPMNTDVKISETLYMPEDVFRSVTRSINKMLDLKPGVRKFVADNWTDLESFMKENFKTYIPHYRAEYKNLMKKAEYYRQWCVCYNGNGRAAETRYQNIITLCNTLLRSFDDIEMDIKNSDPKFKRVALDLYPGFHENYPNNLKPMSILSYIVITPVTDVNIYPVDRSRRKLFYAFRPIIESEKLSKTIYPGVYDLLDRYNTISTPGNRSARPISEEIITKLFNCNLDIIRYLYSVSSKKKHEFGSIARFVSEDRRVSENGIFVDGHLEISPIVSYNVPFGVNPAPGGMAHQYQELKNVISILETPDVYEKIKYIAENTGVYRGTANNRDLAIIQNIIDRNIVPFNLRALYRSTSLAYIALFAANFESIVRGGVLIKRETESHYRDRTNNAYTVEISANNPQVIFPNAINRLQYAHNASLYSSAMVRNLIFVRDIILDAVTYGERKTGILPELLSITTDRSRYRTDSRDKGVYYSQNNDF